MELTVEAPTAVALFDALEAARRGPATRVAVTGTEAAGDVGADGGPGLWSALRKFLSRRREWTVVLVSRDGAGRVVVSRDPADRPALPPAAAQAWNYLKVRLGEFWRGRRVVPDDVAEGRLSRCWVCPYRAESRCSLCGCFLDRVPDDAPVDAGSPGKAYRAAEECPAGRWSRWPIT